MHCTSAEDRKHIACVKFNVLALICGDFKAAYFNGVAGLNNAYPVFRYIFLHQCFGRRLCAVDRNAFVNPRQLRNIIKMVEMSVCNKNCIKTRKTLNGRAVFQILVSSDKRVKKYFVFSVINLDEMN